MKRSVHPTSASQPTVIPPLDNHRLVLFIVTLIIMVVAGGLTIYYNLRQPITNGGQDLFEMISQRFRDEPTIPR